MYNILYMKNLQDLQENDEKRLYHIFRKAGETMKIGVMHWAFYPMIGGVETHLLTVCPEMTKQGAEVYLLTSAIEDEKEHEIISGVNVFRKGEMFIPNIVGWEKQGKDLYHIAHKLFYDFLISNHIDMVHAHNFGIDFYPYSEALLDVCGKLGIPACMIIHNDIFMPAKEPLMWKIVELPWSAYVPISDFISERMLNKRPDLSDRKWVTIKHGIDLGRFKPVEDQAKETLKNEFGFSEHNILLHTGRLLHTKGAYETMQALPEILSKFPETLLVVLGRSSRMVFEADIKNSYYEKVDELIQAKKLKKYIWFGEFPYTEMHNIINTSDIVASPTVEALEPFGLCPVEAMACAKPVIVTRSGGLVESVVDGETGFIIDRNPDTIPDELADCVIKLFSNPSLAQDMGRKGRKRVEKLFDKARMAKELISLKNTV